MLILKRELANLRYNSWRKLFIFL